MRTPSLFGYVEISADRLLLVETIGYVGRLLSSIETPNWTKGPYVMQSALILIAPALLAASIYMTLGRIILLLDAEKCSLIRLRWLTKIFVSGDVLSFLMQASGMLPSPASLLRALTTLRCRSHGCQLGEPVDR